MTKSELVKQISYSTGIDYATALTVVEAFILLAISHLPHYPLQ